MLSLPIFCDRKSTAVRKKRLDFLPLFTLKELRAGSDQRVNEADAVFSGPTACRLDPSVRFPLIGFYWLNDMEIVSAALGVYVGIAGVFFFGALMVGFQSAGAAFLLGKAHDRVLRYGSTPSCIVEK